MRKKYVVSLDLGTSFIKAAAYDEYGVCHGKSSEPVKSFADIAGVYLQRADNMLESVIRCLKNTIRLMGQEKKEIRAVAFTGQMAGFMGVDENWKDITSWSCSLDTRYVPYANRQMETQSDLFWEIAGTNAPLMAPKCEWFQSEYKKESEKIAKYMMISSYVIGRMGDLKIEDATIDASYITWTGLADIKNKKWSETLCGKAGIKKEQLPRIVKSYEICGHLSRQMSVETGLREGIPLISGAGDKIAGCIGAGALKKGDIVFEASSYGAVSSMIETFIPQNSNKNYDVIPAVFSNAYYAHKYIPGSGITLEWFKNQFLKSNEGHVLTFQEIDERIKNIPPGCEGLISIGLLGGSAMPFDGGLKGTFLGHTWSHKSEHFYKSLLEGYGYEIALTLDEIERVYGNNKNNTVKMIGGGARSSIWPQVMADICGREFQCLEKEDIALWGTAVIGGYGIGAFEDIETIVNSNLNIVKTYQPDMKKNHIYNQYKIIYEKMRKDFHTYCKMVRDVSDKSMKTKNI